MKRLFLIFLLFAAVTQIGRPDSNAAGVEGDEILKAAIDAYIYAYPLVLMDVARLYVEKKAGAEDNVFFGGRAFAGLGSASLQGSNVLVFGAWLDLSKGPMILHLPGFSGRSYSAQLIDGWTNVIADLSVDAALKEKRGFVVVGPSWHGDLPSGLTVVHSPADKALVLVRQPAGDAAEDVVAAFALQDRLSLTPLGSYGKAGDASVVQAHPVLTPMVPPSEQVADMDGKTFFTYFTRLLASNPPAASDAAIIANLASPGIVPGRAFNFDGLDPFVQDAISRSVEPAQMRIRSSLSQADPDPGAYLSRARKAVNLAADMPAVCRTVAGPHPADSIAETAGRFNGLEPEGNISVENGILFKAEGRRRPEIGFDIREDIERGQRFLRDKVAGCSQRVEENRIVFRDRRGKRRERFVCKRIVKPNFLLAVEDLKERKLKEVLITPRGCVTRGFHVTRIRDNGVASRFEVAYPEGMAILALRTTVHSGAHGFKEVVYTPYSPEIDTAQVRKAGLDYLTEQIKQARNDLAAKKVRLAGILEAGDIAPMEVSLVLSIIEHIDPNRFEQYRGNEIALVHEVLTVIGANTTEAYSYSKSRAGARGLFQFVPATYGMLLEKYRAARLKKDFISGCRDHVNAAKASLLLFDSDLASLPRKLWSILKDGRSVGMYLAAAYNCGPKRVEKSALACKDRWTCHLPEETKVYLEKFDAVWNLRNGLDK
jgi:hypothetical protein